MLNKIKRALGKLLYSPRVRIDGFGPLKRLGSEYGGWTFRADANLQGATIVSAGLGEDASFDVEFAKLFSSQVILVDPTPRSIVHYDALIARVGKPAAQSYVRGGNQPVESYALESVSSKQLVLEPKALWTEQTTLKFFMPADPRHVSHSITNYQNDYASDGAAIEVPSTTLKAVIEDHGIGRLQILKLDIEGAEISVLNHMLADHIKPVQLLIEFDELMLRTKKALARWKDMDRKLRDAGYRCGFFDGRSCFLYALPA